MQLTALLDSGEPGPKYVGLTTPNGREVWYVASDGSKTKLSERRDLKAHAVAGFDWGYGGSGPAQLALAMLANEAGDETAIANYHEFRRQVIAKLNVGEPFSIPARFIANWVTLNDRSL